MKIQHHRIDTNVVVGLLVREFRCSGTDVSAKVLAMYAGTRTPSMEPQWLAAGLSQHERSLNSNDGWNSIGCMSFMNQPILKYSNEIRSAVLIVHGEKTHSYYFGKDAYENMIKDSKYTSNKELLTIPGAVHTDLYDNMDVIPFDKIQKFFKENGVN